MIEKTRTRRDDRPDIILDAAEAVVRRAGARALTIDAVAAEADLSKGGVLHHFSSKNALIFALMGRKLQRLREGIAEHERRHASDASARPLAMVANARETYCEEDGFPRALLLASAEDPEALADFRAFIAERLAQMTAMEGRPGAGSVLVFAILGLMLGRALGFHNLSGAEADRVFDALNVAARELGRN
jgi:AcrR family transcriptional regulator